MSWAVSVLEKQLSDLYKLFVDKEITEQQFTVCFDWDDEKGTVKLESVSDIFSRFGGWKSETKKRDLRCAFLPQTQKLQTKRTRT